jgi:acetylornithine deacetylase
MPAQGVNAVEIAAELIHTLSQQAKVQGTSEGDKRFDPPYTTIHTGTVHGGTALSIVPGACTFDFEMRHLPSKDPTSLLTYLDDQSHRILDERVQGLIKRRCVLICAAATLAW